MKTKFLTRKEALAQRRWFVVDAAGKVVGRLASEIAAVLNGKHNPNYAFHSDVGDFVVVINAEKVVFTGRKEREKIYYNHSGWVGGLKEVTADKMREKDATQLIKRAVKLMLPKNNLGDDKFKKLNVYVGANHPHAAQQPEPLNF